MLLVEVDGEEGGLGGWVCWRLVTGGLWPRRPASYPAVYPRGPVGNAGGRAVGLAVISSVLLTALPALQPDSQS